MQLQNRKFKISNSMKLLEKIVFMKMNPYQMPEHKDVCEYLRLTVTSRDYAQH